MKVYLVIAMNNNETGSIRVYKEKKDAEQFAEYANNRTTSYVYIIEEHKIQ